MIPISTLISPALWHRRKSRGQEMGVSCLSVPLYCGIKGNPHRKPQISGFPYFETRPNPNSRISALAGTEWCSSTCTTAWLLRQSPANSFSDLDAMFCRQVPELVLRMRRGVSLFLGVGLKRIPREPPASGRPFPLKALELPAHDVRFRALRLLSRSASHRSGLEQLAGSDGTAMPI